MNRQDYITAHEVMKNIENFNFLKFDESYLFETLKPELLKAFDKVTTIDMRSLDQMELLCDECSVGVVREKDDCLYPYICLAIKVKYGYYDANAKQFRISEMGGANFGVRLTPFNCMLDKLNDPTYGIYSGADQELTKKWRRVLNVSFFKWIDGFKAYLEKIKEAKVSEIEKNADERIAEVCRHKKQVCNKAEEEYNAELEALVSE